ncbi:MAG: alpha/beta hydrolase-fold protein [Saprospiraceae bacterium]
MAKIILYSLISGFLLLSCSGQLDIPEKNQSDHLISIGNKEKIYSKILQEEREVFISVPKGFYGMNEQSPTFPVVYVMDGESQFLTIVGVLDQLSAPASANDVAPQMIVVGIPNTNRNRDLTPTQGIIGRDSASIKITGGAGLMADFIKKELIPYVDSLYPTSAHRVLVGHSLGGLFVLNTLIKYPALFQNYLAIDPFMRWDDQKFADTVIEAVKTIDDTNISLFIATANTRMSWMNLDDVKTDTTDIMYLMRSNLEFRDKMAASELKIKYTNQYYENEDHFQIPLMATYDGFRYFYDFYPFQQMIEYYYPRDPDEEGDLIQELENHYKKISQAFGYEILPMESYVNSWAFGFVQFGRPELANRLFDLNIKNYPESPVVYGSKGYYSLSQGDTIGAIAYFEKSLNKKELPHIKSALANLKKDVKGKH